MARCYHDEQEFKSDVDIEVAREGDILQEGQDLDQFKCHKNPGHSGFIPFKDLTLEDLPEEVRSIETLESVKTRGKYVARLVVDKIRNGRWVKEAGTGYVHSDGKEFCIQTNNHIVKTDEEVKNCTVQFFYDSHDESNVLTCRGVELVYTCPFRDLSYFLFDPVPDFVYQLDVIDPLLSSSSIIIMYSNNNIEQYRTELYFKSPKLVYYTSENLNNPQIEMVFITLDDNTISYLKSSYFKFQSIPSNIQELTRIEIHIDEDDGNSRVIPGDVVKFSNDYVVNISESIFQDEVKKCRLVWNGEVIAQGTRLYFQQVKSREFFSDMDDDDLEETVQQASPNIWLFDFYPLPKVIEQYNETVNNNTSTCDTLCCIGHPHGGIKMVTFGRFIGRSPERFDFHGRRITQPGTDCQCKEVSCVKYSCKTCPGSSGSPVFIPERKYNTISNISHFMGERVKALLPNGTSTNGHLPSTIACQLQLIESEAIDDERNTCINILRDTVIYDSALNAIAKCRLEPSLPLKQTDIGDDEYPLDESVRDPDWGPTSSAEDDKQAHFITKPN
ncbi:hypothetical protein LOTGIDRAFT_153911 [Lottia gigantea]|uniref:Serine protease n=1 Tax=Lottia gigantea TaxID=225164 RepID=V4A456_LOTGI|nr:hypothetical protein LOTGIDRAFT_153911 [Lottia gigantea]ESO91467.1 hypothetical protein LOTGIDRAFT_153911 [Lottia gigantea]